MRHSQHQQQRSAAVRTTAGELETWKLNCFQRYRIGKLFVIDGVEKQEWRALHCPKEALGFEIENSPPNH